MIFLDTGFFIALFTPDDELNPRASSWAESLDDELMLVTEYVMWECINHFSKPQNRATAHAIMDYVNDGGCAVVDASRELFEAGLKLHRSRPDKEWSLTDCISFHVMKQRQITKALSYDHHFEQAGFDPLLRRDP